MEGIPRLPMLTPDFKYPATSLPSEFSVKIKEYILIHYEDDPSKYDAAINEMESLRAKFGRLSADVETVCQMKRYYAQLTMMKSRFPMEEGDPIRIPFSWLDKALDVPNSAVHEDVNFELSSVMFNIGAVHAAVAANETRSDLDSIKNAFTHFQCAAYPFQYIRDNMNATKFSTVDFEPSVLTFYVNVLLAQAQECILEKSLIDHRRNLSIVKIAIHLRDIYDHCKEHLQNSGLSDVILSSKYKEWVRTCEVKSELFGAIAMTHLGDQADADKKMGHRLAYYQIALDHIKAAIKFVEKDKRESLKQAVVFANDVVAGKEAIARKENDFIYHERVPKPDELQIFEGVIMVKPIGFDATDRSISGDDLFAALLPMNVLRSVSIYSEEKAKYKREIRERVAAKDKELDDYLSSLQLDEINIDSSIDELKLPDMLLERSAAFTAQPDAFPELLDKLQRVGSCAIEADHKLDDLTRRLAAIDSPDLTHDEGFIAITKELSRINEHHMKARTNNTELQRAIAAHSENLRILALPLSELNYRISGPVIKPSETAEGAQLKRMLDKAAEMRRQRSQLIEDLNKDLDNDDITAKCLTEKDSDNADLYKKELAKHEGITKLINMNLDAQVNVLNALTDANANFAECRRQVMQLSKSRTEQVMALIAAYDVYIDVLQKADEGLKFYSTLFSLVRTLDEAVEGIESAYEDEVKKREKVKKELEERARELRMAREAKEAMETFNAKNGDNINAMTSNQIGSLSLSESTQQIGGGRLKDYLAYYRCKMAGQLPPSSIRFNDEPSGPKSLPGSNGSGHQSTSPYKIVAVPSGLPLNTRQDTAGYLAQAGPSSVSHQIASPGPSSQPLSFVGYNVAATAIAYSPLSKSVIVSPRQSQPDPQNMSGVYSAQIPQQTPTYQAGMSFSGPQLSEVPNFQPKQQQNPIVLANIQTMDGRVQRLNQQFSMPNFNSNQQLSAGAVNEMQNYRGQEGMCPDPQLMRNPYLKTIQPTASQPEQFQTLSAFRNFAPQGTFQCTVPLPGYQGTVISNTSALPSITNLTTNTGFTVNSSAAQNRTVETLPPTMGAYAPSHVPETMALPGQSSRSSVDQAAVGLPVAPSVPSGRPVPSFGGGSPFVPIKTPAPSVIPVVTAANTAGLSNSQFRPPCQPITSNYANSPWHQGIVNSMTHAPTSQVNNICPNICPDPAVRIQSNGMQLNASFRPISSSPGQQGQVIRPTAQKVDLLSSPLQSDLPAPLLPSGNARSMNGLSSASAMTKQQDPNAVESAINNSQILHSDQYVLPSQTSTIFSAASVAEGPVFDRTCLSSNAVAVQPSPRPAAAVAPIVQSNSSCSLANDVILGMTSVTSLSYSGAANTSQKVSGSGLGQVAGPSDMSTITTVRISSESGTSLGSILNPQTFTIGEPDIARLEKRRLREQMKMDGASAQLPPLNPADPLNRLDAHFWVKK